MQTHYIGEVSVQSVYLSVALYVPLVEITNIWAPDILRVTNNEQRLQAQKCPIHLRVCGVATSLTFPGGGSEDTALGIVDDFIFKTVYL